MLRKANNQSYMLCPIQNTATFKTAWIQARPRITQRFGENPQIYKQFKMKGHNGIDFGIPEGTPIFAPFNGIVQIIDSGKSGYGKHLKLRSKELALECVLGHLSEFNVVKGQVVHIGDKIGFSGNTGFSTGPHLHFGVRPLKLDNGDLFKMQIASYDNGYFGYFNPIELLITWKGSLLLNNL